ETPIVALTADALDGTSARCLRAGCDGYSTKPVDRPVLFGLLRSLVEAKRSGAAT
ncbi:MAG: CheY-like chemotaxis protein, partial [Candidatus Paceibacteria bacterium]